MITIKKMRELEELATDQGISVEELMENAGKAVFEAVTERYDLIGKTIVVFAGQGNNGGDAFVAARYFAEENPVVVLFFGDVEKMSEESELNYNRIKKHIPIFEIRSKDDLEKFHLQPSLDYLFIDGLLGTGLKGIVREPFDYGMDLFNSQNAVKVAIDIPSGINGDTGKIEDKCCEVELIVCFHDLKKGLEKLKEKIIVMDIGIPDDSVKIEKA